MVGYTSIAEALGEEQTYHLMQKVHQELSEAIHAHSGTVEDNAGDGIIAIFGAPIAIENAPLMACRAALDILQRISRLAETIEKEHGIQPNFRVGIHSGPIVIGAMGDKTRSIIKVLGDTVNLAARIEAQAESGSIWLSETSFRLIEGLTTCHPMGERLLKGKSEPQNLWRLDAINSNVTSFDAAQGRGLTGFVGRTKELEELELNWSNVAKGGLQTTIIIGEAGIGKSRIVYEFRKRAHLENALFLEGVCDIGDGGKPFAALIKIVRGSFRIPEHATQDEAKERLLRGLNMLGIDGAENAPYLLHLLGFQSGIDLSDIAHETLGIRIRDLILQVLEERCTMSPTTIYIDNMQWADQATIDLIQRCIERLNDVPLFILTTTRPERTYDWGQDSGVKTIMLKPLGEHAVSNLVQEKLHSDKLPDALLSLVYTKSQGNPLFAEEIVQNLLQSDVLKITDGIITIAGDATNIGIPSTVENLLMSQFDQLDDGLRTLLETAAVVGNPFNKELVKSAVQSDTDSEILLQELVEKSLLQNETVGHRLSFRKTLARDAIYASLLSNRRQDLHRQVALAIEAKPNSYAADDASQLAYHWVRSETPERAIKSLAIEGEASLRVYALDEAEANFERALDLIGDPEAFADRVLVADIVLNYARVLYFSCEFLKFLEFKDRYLPLFEGLSDGARLSRFLFEIGYMQFFAGDVTNGRKTLARSKALGEAANDDLAIAYAMLGNLWMRSHWDLPSVDRTNEQTKDTEWIVKVGREHNDIWLASKALLALATDHMVWGHPREVREVCSKMISLSRDTNDPRPRTLALFMMGAESLYSGDYQTAIEQAEEALRIGLSPFDRAMSQSVKATGLIFQKKLDEGLALGMPSMKKLTEGGDLFNTANIRIMMGVAQLMQGHMAVGMRAVHKAAQEPFELNQSAPRPSAQMLTGEVYLELAVGTAKPPLSVMLKNLPFLLRTLPLAKSRARNLLTKAMEGFREHDSPAHIARCLLNLAKLDISGRKPLEARTKLLEAQQLASTSGALGVLRDTEMELAKL